MRLVSVLLCAICFAVSLQAQEGTPEPLVVPFTPIPPFMSEDADGQKSGFIVSLSELIGAEIGVPIDYLNVANSAEFVGAQVSGQTQMIAGILQLPPLLASNVFSHEVARDELRPAVLTSQRARVAAEGLIGQRIAVVPPAAGSQEPFLDRNTPVVFESPQAALMALLTESVDAVLLPPPVVYGLARRANVDGRIGFYGEPVRVSTRHVALHESRADLLPKINDAIAALEADGRLEALRQRYNITVPPPSPEVLTVGAAHFPPHLIVEEDGGFSGFIVDAMRDVARLGNVQIEFVDLPTNMFVQGPNASGTDAIAGLVQTAPREQLMDFTYPVRQVPIEAHLLGALSREVAVVGDLSGLRVGVLQGSIVETVAKSSGDLNLVGFASNEAALEAMIAKELDAVLAVAGTLTELVEDQGAAGQVRRVPNPVLTVDTAIALRFGLGSVRDRLNAVLPGYLLSARYAALDQQYYGEVEFWTRGRLYWLVGVLSAVFLALMGGIIWQRRLAFELQAAELAREQAHSAELNQLVSAQVV